MMDATNIQFLGTPCGRHGPYTFYKALKYDLRGKTRMLSLGEFFFVKIMADSPLCIGEIQLLWQDKNHDDIQLASVRLYFLPEHSPDGRQPHHGEDELLAETEKVILSVEDLLKWRVEDGVSWSYGRLAVQDDEVTKGQSNLYCPPGSDKAADELIQAFSANNRQAHLSLDLDDLKMNICADVQESLCKNTQVVVLSFAQYCRYRAVIERLRGCSNIWLKSILISALGGFTVKSPDTRIHFCRETFDHPELEDHDFRLDHLAPNLKGRPRKKRLASKKDWSPGDSDSNDSYERVTSEAPKPRDVHNVYRPNSHGILSGHRKNGSTSTEVVLKKRRKISELDEKTFFQELYTFMRERRTPISRMPTLGFKEINLFEFYVYAQKLGGYEEVTNKRLWKHIYDRLGGNPSNTSAATCTRRHYEKLLLPYEMHVHGITPKIDISVQKRKSVSRSVCNTVRNHLKETTQGKCQQMSGSVRSDPDDDEMSKAASISNGMGFGTSMRSASAYTLNVPNAKMLGASGLNQEGGKSSDAAAAKTYIVPLNVPASASSSASVLLPPSIALTPGISVPGGMFLSFQQLQNAETLSNASTASSSRHTKGDPKPKVSQNGAFCTTSDSVPCSRPSVIRHSSSRKPILNPVPMPRPNIPRAVYGPPNVLASPPTGDGSWSRLGLSSLQPHVGSPAPRHDPVPRMLMPSHVRVVENKPEVIQVIDDEPTDLSMSSSRRSTNVPATAQPTPRRTEAELPLNLSLKAHNTPKAPSTCVPKLPVNPFRSQTSEQRVHRPTIIQRPEVTTTMSGRRSDAPPSGRLNVHVTENSAVINELPPDVISLGSLPIIHPAFPFPLNTLPVVTGAPPQSSTSTAPATPVSSLNTSLLAPNVFYPGLPTFPLPPVGTQLYPHLYQDSSSPSQKNS